MNILAIETSCDETACAIVKDGVTEIASTLATSKELHLATGGVVPEIAARKQIEFIVPVIEQTIKKAGEGFARDGRGIDAVAVTVGPGLVGSLLVGVEAAKALALAWNKPLIPVNHLIGHIYANFILRTGVSKEGGSREKISNSDGLVEFPAVALVISGGHTDLVLMRGHGDFEFIGGTLDDAAGEAFDKTARLLGLAKYLGGAELSKLAASCTKNLAQGKLPRPMLDRDNFDFSFSGLKTAVKNLIEEGLYPADSVACEFETALTDVVIAKTIRAAEKFKCKQILVGGGVAANNYLKARMISAVDEKGINVLVPDRDLCTDNAIYIASAAFFNSAGRLLEYDLNKSKSFAEVVADPSLGIMDLV